MRTKHKKPVAAVTGARGHIGRYLIAVLLENGWEVKALTRANTLPYVHGVSIVRGDINNGVALQELLIGADAIFHCAAELYDETKMHDVNVKGVETILDLLSSTSVNYFCYISSAGVVGPTRDKLITEETKCQPQGEYEKSKYKAEKLVMSSRFEGNICILRPTNVISAYRKGLLMLPFRNNRKDRLTCFVKGRERAHLVHAKDVAAAAVFFYDKSFLAPEVFFVSCDEDHQNTLSGVYDLVLKYLGKKNKNCFVSLPVIIPYLLRYLFKGASLHGNSRFSSQKIKNAGFTFSLGFERAVIEVCEHSKN